MIVIVRSNEDRLYAFHSQQGDPGFQPPKLPIPDETINEGTPIQIPRHSAVFSNLCQLWVIVHDILCRYFPKELTPDGARFDREFVRTMLGRLLALGNQFPLDLARGSQADHSVIVLQ